MTFDKWLEEYGDKCSSDSWMISESGVYKKTDNGAIRMASSTPVMPVAIYHNIDTNIEKVKLCYFKAGRKKEVTVPRSWLATQNGCTKLSDFGIDVTAINYRNFIEYCSNALKADMEEIDSRSCFGWYNDSFIPYSGDVKFDGDVQFRQIAEAIAEKGNLEEWVDYVRPLRENIYLRLTMAVSFASPLIEIVGENPFLLHLWGGSGAGKTVAMQVAMSVWGDPNNGKLVRTLNMTKNSMLATAAVLNNIPFAGDELQTLKTKFNNSYDQMIMQLAEGIDRGRMNNDKLNETKSWHCAFITNGEEPCVKEDSGGGVVNRVIEIDCSGKIVVSEGNAVSRFVKQHYGCAGKDYIAAIDKDAVCSEYASNVKLLIDSFPATPKQAGAMALIMVADRIARELLFPGERQLTVDDVKCFLKTEADVSVGERAYQYVISKIAEFGSYFGDDSRQQWGEFDDTGKQAFILRSVLVKILQEAGYDFNACKKTWVENNYIEKSEDGRYRTPHRIGAVTASCIKMNMPNGFVLEKCNEPLPF